MKNKTAAMIRNLILPLLLVAQFFSQEFKQLNPLPWSLASSWPSNIKPVAGDTVTIPQGTTIILDENTPNLAGLIIHGTLLFDTINLNLSSAWILVHGTFQIGTEEEPYKKKAIITLTGDDPNVDIMGMGTRGILAMNGSLEFHGSAPNKVWTKINQHANQGDTIINLIETVDWATGDQIVIAPTDYYEAANGNSVTQRVSLSSVAGNVLTLNEGLNAFRWGLLQYATANGMSLLNTNTLSPPTPDTDSLKTPVILDQRAAVGNLTRNILIQAPDDDLWNNQGFGVHTMIMGTGSARIEGVEFRRAGQRGRMRRYPYHAHELSYNGSQTLADVTGQYFRKNTINSSANRGIVIHGTNGLLVKENIVYDVRGHGIFTEDAVERRNIIDSNLVMHVRNPIFGTELKQHETGTFGSSGFWISNPDNIVTNNISADHETFGFWLAFPEQPWGSSTSVLHTDGLVLRPNRLLFGVFDNNTSHSNRLDGIMLDNVEIDNAGNTAPRQYQSTVTGREVPWPFTDRRRFTLSRYKTWKNRDNGIWDRAVWVTNTGAVSADNCGRFFAGSGQDGLIERSLVIGTSLNHLMNGTDRPAQADFAAARSSSAPAAFATYHSTFDIKNNIVINFPIVNNVRSGVFATEDYYLIPVDKGQMRNVNNMIIQSHPGVKLTAAFNHFTLASALWDPHGIWGPAGNYVIYDIPFLTHGKTTTVIEPGPGSGGVSATGPFYGFEGFVLHGIGDALPQNQPWNDNMAISVRRLNQDLEEVAVWNVAGSVQGELLSHMRDFVTSPDGIYELTFPNEANSPTNFQMNVYNMLTTDDTQVIGIEYDKSLKPTVFMQSNQFYQVYTELESLDSVRNSDGETWWQDKCNGLVWIKLKGGFWQFWTTDTTVAVPSSDDLLYKTTQIRITGVSDTTVFASCNTDTLNTSTSLLLNPTQLDEVTFVHVSNHELSTAPISFIFHGSDSTELTFDPINGSAYEFSEFYRFLQAGNYSIKTISEAEGSLRDTVIRNFNVSFSKNSTGQNIHFNDLEIIIPDQTMQKNSMILSEYHSEQGEYQIQSNSAGLLKVIKLEFDITPFENPEKLFVYRIDGSTESELETQVYIKKKRAITFTKQLGKFRIKENPLFSGSNLVPEIFALLDNYPNPFNPVTTIPFNLAEDGFVKIDIYNSLGQHIKTLFNGFLRAGNNKSIEWNGLNSSNEAVSSGIYFYRLQTNKLSFSKKMILLK